MQCGLIGDASSKRLHLVLDLFGAEIIFALFLNSLYVRAECY